MENKHLTFRQLQSAVFLAVLMWAGMTLHKTTLNVASLTVEVRTQGKAVERVERAVKSLQEAREGKQGPRGKDPTR